MGISGTQCRYLWTKVWAFRKELHYPHWHSRQAVGHFLPAQLTQVQKLRLLPNQEKVKTKHTLLLV